MKPLEECVVNAMDGSDKELFSFLTYILQDIWEIGAEPDVIIELVKKHFSDIKNLNVLDLGCGKGAVSVNMAKKLACHCHGIDAIPDFIEFAKDKAKEYEVTSLCTFETGDIRLKVKELPKYDVIILGAIGPVFGDFYTTLTTLSGILKQGGAVIIDDGYTYDNSPYAHPMVLKHSEMLQQIHEADMQLVESIIIETSDFKEDNDLIFTNLKKRCEELMLQYPEKKSLFANYIKEQETENEALENSMVCATMLIRKI